MRSCVVSHCVFGLSIGAAALVATVPSPPIPLWYYAAVTLWLGIYSSVGTLHFVAVMAFFNRVSDPLLGGTYMTLLNTIGNLGSKWSSSGILYLFDFLASRNRQCVDVKNHSALGLCMGESKDAATAACEALGGRYRSCPLSFLNSSSWQWQNFNVELEIN